MNNTVEAHGYIKLFFHPIKVDEIIQIATNLFQNQFQEKEINFEIKIDEKLPHVNVDLEKISFVLISILGNALRYTPRWGKIVLKAYLEDNFVTISVKDSGNGVPARVLDKIFQPLVQTPNNERPLGGGLGLSIAREIIEAHNATISAKSTLEQGSEFAFTLPIA